MSSTTRAFRRKHMSHTPKLRPSIKKTRIVNGRKVMIQRTPYKQPVENGTPNPGDANNLRTPKKD